MREKRRKIRERVPRNLAMTMFLRFHQRDAFLFWKTKASLTSFGRFWNALSYHWRSFSSYAFEMSKCSSFNIHRQCLAKSKVHQPRSRQKQRESLSPEIRCSREKSMTMISTRMINPNPIVASYALERARRTSSVALSWRRTKPTRGERKSTRRAESHINASRWTRRRFKVFTEVEWERTASRIVRIVLRIVPFVWQSPKGKKKSWKTCLRKFNFPVKIFCNEQKTKKKKSSLWTLWTDKEKF